MALAFIFESVGVGEWFVLLAVLLIVVGPKRLPETARKFGQYYAKFRRAAESFKRQLLDMDNEVTRAVKDVAAEVESASQQVEDSFKIEGPDAAGEPSVPGEPESGNDGADKQS